MKIILGKAKRILLLALLLVIWSSIREASVQASSGDNKRVSVHDPSIVSVTDAAGKKTYYIYGTHIAQAKSEDLQNWTAMFSREYENPTSNPIFGNFQTTFASSFEWAGYKDGDSSGGYSVWAPDVIWNGNYVWTDGSGDVGAYMLYYSASSTWRRSCIGYTVSRDIEGPFEAGGTVVYSGFTKFNSTDGSTRSTNYVNTHLDELIAAGTIDGFNDKWATNNGLTYQTDYAPNAIDPTLFYDEDNTLWMVYGSWSGGIFMLEIDTLTGKPIYPGTDGTTGDGRVIDRYFGIKVAGGYHMSGEGPYIVYDESTGYYYLFITYGGLAANGGYNMRLFRSDNVSGPYVDAQGNTPIYSNRNYKNDDYGIKVMGNYTFGSLDYAYKSPGHNSAFIDDDGQWYLVYHTRFDQGSERHEVRVHQMFMNEDGWPVTSVYENAGDTISATGYSAAEVVGDYEFVNHGVNTSSAVLDTLGITLNSDGTVTGDVAGTWEVTLDNNVKIQYNGITYKGVFFRQQDESAAEVQVMTFTAIGDNNETIWGSKVAYNDMRKVQRAADRLEIVSETIKDIMLPGSGSFDVDITWTSGDESVITTMGEVTRHGLNKTVTLTANLSKNGVELKKTFEVTVVGTWDYYTPLYLYDFEDIAADGTIINKGSREGNSNATLIGTAQVIGDDERGDVLEVSSSGNVRKENYLALPLDTFDGDLKGFTIGMWVNVDSTQSNYSQHSALFEANGGGTNIYPVTRIGANLWGRINSNGSFVDVTSVSETLPANAWHYVTYTVSESGLSVYLDGVLIGNMDKDLAGCFNNNFLRNLIDVRVGSGNIWNDIDITYGMFDNVAVYGKSYDAAEVLSIYQSQLITGYNPIEVGSFAYEQISMPEEVTISMQDGSRISASVEWELISMDKNVPGDYIVKGVLTDYANYSVEATVTIKENGIVSVTVLPKRLSVSVGDVISLSEEVTVTAIYLSGLQREVEVIWDEADTSKAGTYIVNGNVAGYEGIISVELIVNKKPEETKVPEDTRATEDTKVPENTEAPKETKAPEDTTAQKNTNDTGTNGGAQSNATKKPSKVTSNTVKTGDEATIGIFVIMIITSLTFGILLKKSLWKGGRQS